LLLSQPENVVGASTQVGIVDVLVRPIATRCDFILEHGYLLLELSRVSTRLDDTFLERADVVVNCGAVIAA
jgi:hypothetical protein